MKSACQPLIIKSSTAQINFLKIWNKQISKNYFCIFVKILENNENIQKIQKEKMEIL